MINPNDNLVQAARAALDDAMEQDGRVLVLGEDVASGGPFALTKGLSDRHGAERVRNTPICESSFVGAGIGLALAGGRPFVDIMFNDFLTVAADQLFNNAAKIHYMGGGQMSVPLTVWTIAGAEGRWGAHHSQHLAGWLVQVPGLKVLTPSTPAMMYASVREALEDPDPVVLLVDRPLLYSRVGLPGDESSPWHSRVVQAGTDVTLAAAGRLVHVAIEAASSIDASVEIIDLQRLAPLSVDTIVESVHKTNRLVIAHDEVSCGGLSSMIESGVCERAFWDLDAPVKRVMSPATPVPAAGVLEDEFIVTAEELAAGIEEALNP